CALSPNAPCRDSVAKEDWLDRVPCLLHLQQCRELRDKTRRDRSEPPNCWERTRRPARTQRGPSWRGLRLSGSWSDPPFRRKFGPARDDTGRSQARVRRLFRKRGCRRPNRRVRIRRGKGDCRPVRWANPGSVARGFGRPGPRGPRPEVAAARRQRRRERRTTSRALTQSRHEDDLLARLVRPSTAWVTEPPSRERHRSRAWSRLRKGPQENAPEGRR